MRVSYLRLVSFILTLCEQSSPLIGSSQQTREIQPLKRYTSAMYHGHRPEILTWPMLCQPSLCREVELAIRIFHWFPDRLTGCREEL